jgi:cell division protein FtsA
MYNTVLGLLIKGDINCAGRDIDPNGNLFDEEEHEEQVAPERRPRQIHEIETGTIRTAQEEERAAEEARRKKEAEEAAEEEMRRLQEEEERRKKKEKSLFNRAKKWLEGLAAPEE